MPARTARERTSAKNLGERTRVAPAHVPYPKEPAMIITARDGFEGLGAFRRLRSTLDTHHVSRQFHYYVSHLGLAIAFVGHFLPAQGHRDHSKGCARRPGIH
jgi:hypothetical protein